MPTAPLLPGLSLLDPRRLALVALVALAAVTAALTTRPAEPVATPAPQAVPSRAAAPTPAQPGASAGAKAKSQYTKLPLTFVPNRGQSPGGVRYQASGAGYHFAFHRRGVTLGFSGRGHAAAPALAAPTLGSGSAAGLTGLASAQNATLDLRFVGANPRPGVRGADRAPGRVNYLVGDHSSWHRNISTYSALAYSGLWKGIDMRFLGKPGELKYEFGVAPGADPSRIALDYGGAAGLSVAADGGLRVATRRGTLKDSAPVAYQLIDGRRVPVTASYRLNGRTGYGFTLGAYDHSRPLVIDPGVDYGTYLGGTNADEAFGVATDSSGNTYVTGFMSSSDYPTTPGAFDTTANGGSDGFVTKLSADGTTAVYSTYLGGSSSLDYPNAIAVDSSGAAYVMGYTESTNFPTAGVGVDTTYNGSGDMFVSKLSSDGSSLPWSTYLGGTGGDGYQQNGSIALDSAGNSWVDSVTQSTDFPVPGTPAQSTSGGGFSDGVLAKLNTSGVQTYGTYIGGTGADRAIDVAVGPSDAVYVSGSTNGSFPTTAGAYDTTYNDTTNDDAFVAKYTSAGAKTYATYVGSNSTDIGQRIAVDSSGNAYVAGSTYGSDFPTTLGAAQTTSAGGVMGYVTKLNSTGAALVYSTLLGGTEASPTFLTALAVDSSGNAYVAGETSSPTFPTTAGASQTTLKNGGPDGFMTKFNDTGTGRLYSTYFGGTDTEVVDDLALSPLNTARIVGWTYSTAASFPVTAGAFDTTRAGGVDSSSSRDGFMVNVDPGGALTPQCSDGVDNDGDTKIDYPADPGCTSAADNTEAPNPSAPGNPKPKPKPQPAVVVAKPAPAKTKKPATCKRRNISLLQVSRSGRRVKVRGLVAPSLAGQKVTILGNYGRKRLATVTPASNGRFSARVKAPSRRIAHRARYRARVGKSTSAVLKLYQQLHTTSVKVSGKQVTVRGKVQRSLLGRRNRVVIKRLFCGHYKTVGSARPNRKGVYSVRFSVENVGEAALYRAETRVLRTASRRQYVKRYARAVGVRLTDETG